ncbi:MAG TPA: terminase gpA endonuclease subunit [Blastocatellia bacterium]|nr:terminase gpA endonuclease subunit [Blastocatellia bacterium]
MDVALIGERIADAAAVYDRAARDGARPDPAFTISQWADQFRQLSARSSPEPGPWRTSRAPFLRAIMDDLSPASRVETVVFQKGAQIGGTEAGNNWVGFVIHMAPGPMLVVQPTIEMARRNSKQRIGPLIEDSVVLRTRVKDSRSRDSSNTLLSKEFPGGLLVMTGANSAKGLRSMSARYLFLDEVDGYKGDVEGEGEPCGLAIARTTNFARRKIFIVSTPTVSGHSRIERFYEDSDKRQYWVPCPHCGEKQVLVFAQLRWQHGKPETARYHCAGCGEGLANHHKAYMLPRGEWRPDGAENPRTHGYHLSSLYSPVGWLSWEDVARKREEAGEDPQKQQIFVNTILGLPWLDVAEAPDADRLYERREDYMLGVVPEGGILVTAGVDVQARRLECEIVAWGRDRHSWSVDYRVFDGDTSQPQVWENITKLLDEDIPTEYGQPTRIAKLAIDTGFNTMAVYDYVRRMSPMRVMGVKGSNRPASLVGSASMVEVGPHGSKLKYGIRLWPVNVDIAKEELYRWLRSRTPDLSAGESWPVGFCHFPNYSREYFEQLTAERLVTSTVRGMKKTQWEKHRERNEALDCFDASTEVLTDEGWKRFIDLSGQKVATVELETDAIEFQRPSDLIIRQYSGDMVHLQGRRIDILTTPAHRMVTYLPSRNGVVGPQVTLARELTQRHQIKLTGQWLERGAPQITIPASHKSDSGMEIEPERHVDAMDLARFYGWWITEGSAAINEHEGSVRRLVSICQTKKENVEAIARLLDRLPWRFSWNDGVHKFTATSKQLFDEVAPWGRLQESRRIPSWIKQSSRDVIEAFLQTAVLGDGWLQSGDCRVIATVCEKLADDYQELFLKLGSAPRSHRRESRPYEIRGRTGDNTRDQFHVHENSHVKRAYLDGGANGQRGFIGRTVQHQGTVYCATVPNGTLICRRNGQVFVAGNCRIYARAAAASMRFESWNEARWQDLQDRLTSTERKNEPASARKPVAAPKLRTTPMPQFQSFSARTDFTE